MTPEDFAHNLATKFRAKNDDDKNAVFAADLAAFSANCPEIHLQDVYNWISSSHKYSTPFQMAKIYGFARDNGFIHESKRDGSKHYRRCNGFSVVIEENGETRRDHVKCATSYSMESGGCPNCHSTNADLVECESIPGEVVILKEDCHRCIRYSMNHKTNTENGVFGPECSEHGRKDKHDSYCQSCKCIDCCKYETIYRQYPRGIDTERIPEWIGANLVQGLHIRSESRMTPPEKEEEKKKPDFFGVDIQEVADKKKIVVEGDPF